MPGSAVGGGRVERVIAGMVGVSLPLTTDVLQVVTTDTAPPIFPHIVTHVRGNLTVKQSRTTGKILIGGAWRGEGDPLTGVKRVCRDSLVGNLAWACQNIPGIARASLLRAWVGFEGRTPDKLLMCGSIGSPAGFHVLGCTGGGYTISPAAGLVAAQQILGEPTSIPVKAFEVRRLMSTTVGRSLSGRDHEQPGGDGHGVEAATKGAGMNNGKVDWHGSFVAVVTPFTKQGAIDEQAFCDNVRRMVDEGVDGVVVSGCTGESWSLDHDERLRLYRLALDTLGRTRADYRRARAASPPPASSS